jgi:hypothetical protein
MWEVVTVAEDDVQELGGETLNEQITEGGRIIIGTAVKDKYNAIDIITRSPCSCSS